MRTTLICNPQSGGGNDVDGTADELRRLGADVVEIAHQPSDAKGEGAERIVVVGGDGTIAPAAALAGRLGVPLAVVPAGTANDFARALGLADDREAAIALAARGTSTRSLELAWMGETPFVNVASAGLSPAAARRAEPFKRVLGPLAYAVGGLLAGARERPLQATVTADGREAFAGKAWQVTVAASGAFGGGSEIEQADPQDGRLDLVVVPAGSRLALIRRAVGMRRGDLAEQPGVVHLQADELEVDVPAGTSFNVDGEVVEAPGRTTFRVQEAAFALVAP